MILGQLRIWARQTTYAALDGDYYDGDDDDGDNYDDDDYDDGDDYDYGDGREYFLALVCLTF